MVLNQSHHSYPILNQIYYQIYLKEDVMEKNICGKYHQNNKKSNRKKVNQTNIEAKNINIKLKFDDTVLQSLKAEAFFISKDHKHNLLNFLTFRFINLLNRRLVKLLNQFLTRLIMR